MTAVNLKAADGTERGTYSYKTVGGRSFALLGRRWCRIARRENGDWIEVWTRGGKLEDSKGNFVGANR